MSRKKAIWPIATAMMVAVLILASCGPKVSTTTTTVPAVVPTSISKPTATVTPAPVTSAEPKYGGIINVVVPSLATGEVFEPLVSNRTMWGEGYVVEQMLTDDYSKSAAGTGEIDLGLSTGPTPSVPSFKYLIGWLADSWEAPQNGVWVLNIRQGVHFGSSRSSEVNSLVNGRAMTTDDVVASLKALQDFPGSAPNISVPGLEKNMTVEKTGEWQVTVKTPVDSTLSYTWLMGGGGVQYVWPKEWMQKYATVNDWRNVVGTGPYWITDYVSGSAITLSRNSNYWRTDPVGAGKGKRLPYPDGLKVLIAPDESTRLAAMRTGAGDMTEGVSWDDNQNLSSSRASLQSKEYLPWEWVVAMRTDKKDLPYNDVRVRQALMMATDMAAIKKNLYHDQAEILALPVDPAATGIYWPLQTLPQSVQALYNYNPTGAQQLLQEAGYPKGFKAAIVLQNDSLSMDLAQVLKAMWIKVGIDLEIQPKESGVYTSIKYARSYAELFMHQGTPLTSLGQRGNFALYKPSGPSNLSYVDDPAGTDPQTDSVFKSLSDSFMSDPQKLDQTLHDWIPYVLGKAYYVALPDPYSYRVWQPWIKHYYGEGNFDYAEPWAAFPWVDQDLKEQITGRR
jgi:peptide/nickel transport system substrate-binding protein